MPKPAVRSLIQLRRRLDDIEADLATNRQDTVAASATAIAQLNLAIGEERIVKFSGENWRVVRDPSIVRVLPLVVDEDI